MQITHLGHACLLVESADVRVLIDPGSFTGDFTQLRDLHVIVVTHQHRDHLDPKSFTARYNAEILVWYEVHSSITAAIDRETQIKKWNRPWKERLINEMTPTVSRCCEAWGWSPAFTSRTAR